MKRHLHILLCFFLLVMALFAVERAGFPEMLSASVDGYLFDLTREVPMESGEIKTVVGTTGGVHMLAEPGELIIEVEKRDLNKTDAERELRAILVGPDRQVIEEKRIPDDGWETGAGIGPPQRVIFQTDVERQGVYSLNITVSGARMDTDIIWGFRTNSERYLVESARGHRDDDHEEPIVLRNPEESTDVWFMPPDRAFDLEITDFPESAEQLTVYDDKGNEIQTLDVRKGEVHTNIVAEPKRENRLWRVAFPAAQATLQIDGVTRWSEEDPYRDLSFWTTDVKSWFPYHKYRWLLTPYNRRVYANNGETGTHTFEVHNNAPDPRTIELSPEFSRDPFEVEIKPERVTLTGGETADVSVRYTVPEGKGKQTVHLRAEPLEDPGYSTYSTLMIETGEPLARQPFETPLILKPYQHENTQLGYVADYPTDWEMYFDLENRPLVRVDGGLITKKDDQWQKKEFVETVQSRNPAFRNTPFDLSRSDTKIAFDRDNDLYHIAETEGRAALLHSSDYGRKVTAYDLGEDGSFDIENYTGHNVPEAPPAILRANLRYQDEEHIWRRVSDLELIVPEKKNGKLVIGDPILISDLSLGVGTHSGHASAIVSRGDKIHIIWGEATDPDEDIPGVPTYITTYNRTEGKLEGDPVLIGYGPPANDVHNRPSITIDSEGYLHALIGTHGQPFLYARSLEPNDAHAGWTEPEILADEELRQTYIGMVCGPDDTLHLVYRLWRYSEEPHLKSHHAVLAYQQKPPGSDWSEPRMLIVSPFSEYSIFYHRLGIDREGRLMLSYDYWSTYWFYRNDYRARAGHYRKTMMSEDGGDTWKLLYTDDL